MIAFCGAVVALGGTVDIQPGADIPSIVAANPAGTTFIIYPGTYRLTQPITPKNGDSFIGQAACAPTVNPCAAIISGGISIGSLATGPDENGNWSVRGQAQQGTLNTYLCDPGWTGCNYPEDLFFDGVPYKHLNATSLPTIAAGAWWFDYTNNIIYFHDDPAGHLVETSVIPSMFGLNDANGVTIENLTIQEFASPTEAGAVDPGYLKYPVSSSANLNWTIQNCYLNLNHAAGIRVAFGTKVINSKLTTNGEEGIGGGPPPGAGITPSGVLIQGNTITYNNYAHVSPGFEAGGIKFGNTADVVVRNNIVQYNIGNGIHFDNNAISPLIDGNTVTDNYDLAEPKSAGHGIRMEIDNVGATIRNNIVQRNGVGGTGPSYQIVSADSAGDLIYCNVVETGNSAHEQAISVFSSNRGNNKTQPFLGQQIVSIANSVHHNTVIWDSGSTSVTGYQQQDTANQPNFFANNTPPDYNQYHISNIALPRFIYDGNDTGSNTLKTFANFQAAGADIHGTIDTLYTSGFPTVAITSPADQSSVTNSVTIAATASDASGINKVEFYVDWNLKVTIAAAPYNFNWSATAGSHTVAAMAYNKAGIRACHAITLSVP